jgi:hypothetical protein
VTTLLAAVIGVLGTLAVAFATPYFSERVRQRDLRHAVKRDVELIATLPNGLAKDSLTTYVGERVLALVQAEKGAVSRRRSITSRLLRISIFLAVFYAAVWGVFLLSGMSWFERAEDGAMEVVVHKEAIENPIAFPEWFIYSIGAIAGLTFYVFILERLLNKLRCRMRLAD